MIFYPKLIVFEVVSLEMRKKKMNFMDNSFDSPSLFLHLAYYTIHRIQKRLDRFSLIKLQQPNY